MLTFRSSMMLRCSRSACTPPPSTAIAFRSTSDAASSMLHHRSLLWLPSMLLGTWLHPDIKVPHGWQSHYCMQHGGSRPKGIGGKELGKRSTFYSLAAAETGHSLQLSQNKQRIWS